MTISYRFQRRTEVGLVTSVRAVIVAAKTVIFTPRHEGPIIHQDVAQQLAGKQQVINPPLPEQLAAISKLVSEQTSPSSANHLTMPDRLGLFACLMQFSMYDRSLPPFMKTDYAAVDKLYKQIVAEGRKQPLSLSRLLQIALQQTDGDMAEALWRLLVTSRQFARWFDGESIDGMPPISSSEATQKMIKFSHSIQALKPYTESYDQDTAGDVYYVWTHALAKLIYGKLSPWYALDSHLMRLALHYGTWLNHQIAHKVSPQTVASDHTIAAGYGNAIGKSLNKSFTRRLS